MTAKITTALHEVMQRVAYVQKGKTNEHFNYRYAGEADLLAVLRPAMVEAGLMLLPSIREVSDIDQYGNVTVTVDYTLIHKDGDVWPVVLTAVGMGNDKNRNGVGDKGVYKAITGANKYLLFKLFQIETGDDPEIPSAFDQMAVTPPTVETAPRILPPAPQVPPTSGFYVPTQHDLTWSSLDEEFQKVIGEINNVGDLKSLGKYWSELTQFRETMQGEDASLVSDMKAAFATRNNQIVGGHLK